MLELVRGKDRKVFFISKAFDLLKDNWDKINNICSFNTRYWIRQVKNNDNTQCFLQSANSNDINNDMNKLSNEENLYSNFIKKNKGITKTCLDGLYNIYEGELKLKTILLQLSTAKTKKTEVVKSIKVKKMYLCRQCC